MGITLTTRKRRSRHAVDGKGPLPGLEKPGKRPQLGVWEKAYNNTITGENWDYPEFKGWHAELYWVTLQNKEADFTVYTDRPAIYLGCYSRRSRSGDHNNTSPPFPPAISDS